ncbi:hypothetical protein XK09_03525 [Campylobacter lanienae]|uniref:Uncharacterized protein n=1 Tax=Campylobacter lanienae TaxID=75658 RepID=A0ABY3G8X3_9BACT|nr:hypothetical protein [Campylobacter lanienae]TWO29708.1 hypothetical protein XK09_03525 [Campylobacter lanienae]
MIKLNVATLNWISFLILLIYTLVCFYLHWNFLTKEFSDVYFVGNEINITMDLNTTLETLITQNKIISPKDYFGIYTSTYSNILMVTVALLGIFALLSFIYVRNKIEDQMNERIDEYFSSQDFKERLNKTLNAEIKQAMDSYYDEIKRVISSLGDSEGIKSEEIKSENNQAKG